MTKITQSQVRLLKKLADDDETGVVKLLASPDVGDFQAFVLATVGRLSPDATTTAILTYIVEVTQEAPDVAQGSWKRAAPRTKSRAKSHLLATP
jgi:hypothetical protein